MSIQSTFSIKDLENLSGVKAHTIRIWEKRYQLLKPQRTNTNIRTYNLVNLQKILSVALLNKHGLKVSKIASLNENQIKNKILELEKETDGLDQSINNLKIAMLNFDKKKFDKTYKDLLADHSVRVIFLEVFIKLLNEIGLLWMTNTIRPAHEKFISNLIKQKLLIEIERVNVKQNKDSKVFILFLPMNEIHDLGLTYIHYELLKKGHNSIYLGTSVPSSDLKEVQSVFSKITFVSYFTVKPTPTAWSKYLTEFSENILDPRKEKLHILGKMTRHMDSLNQFSNVVKHDCIAELLDQL